MGLFRGSVRVAIVFRSVPLAAVALLVGNVQAKGGINDTPWFFAGFLWCFLALIGSQSIS